MLPGGQNPSGEAARRAGRADRARLVRQTLRLHSAVRGAGAGHGPAVDLCRGRQTGQRVLAPRARDLFTLCRSRRGRSRPVEEALNLAYHGARAQDARFNITLEREFDRGLAPMELAPQEMTRVFLNLCGTGFYAPAKR